MRPSRPTDLELDFRERAGFQIGKAAALAEWSSKLEERAFHKLCERLARRNRRAKNRDRERARERAWRAKNRDKLRAIYREQERRHRAQHREKVRAYAREWARKLRREQPERARDALRRWRRKNGERIRAQERERRAARRAPIRLTCGHCGNPFSPRRYRTAKWCSATCRNANHAKSRVRPNKGLRNMKIGPIVFELLRAEPGLSLGEICARDSTLKRGSVATKLCVWVQQGIIARNGNKYRLA